MRELELRSAVERLQILDLAEETAPLSPSASRHLNSIIGKLKEMQDLLQAKPLRKNRVLQIEELNYQVEDVIESYHVLARSSKIWGLNSIKIICLRKFGLGFALQKIKSKIKNIRNKMRLDLFIAPDRSPVERKINLIGLELIGLDEHLKKVLKFPLSHDDAYSSSSSSSSSRIAVPVISICGDVGSGNTTLAKLVFENPCIAGKFQTRIWINVTDKCKIKDILEQIIHCGDRRSLTVLDDIRSSEAWEAICEILQILVKGSFVLVTTRVGRVAEYISQKQFVHNMTPLNEADSFALFTKVFSHKDGDCISCANDEATTSSAENDSRSTDSV
ncbi:hypothetical protein FXO37_28957 [Capsicum annuum]|nr:hypothetical protein FXO37_28957 [Capsicum annuum]